MSSYDPEMYAERQAANDRSRAWAARHGEPWTTTDDAVILERWVRIRPADRDERQVSRDLQRTIESCRNRAHFLAGVHTGIRYSKQEPEPPARYDWMAEWEAQTGSAPIEDW